MQNTIQPTWLQDHGYLDRPEKVVKRLLKERNITSQYHHWTNLWLMMPSVAYRLAATFTTVIPDHAMTGCLLANSYTVGAEMIDRWSESSSTLFLVRDAVRLMLNRCLDAAHFVVRVDEVVWEPRMHGQLANLLSAMPDATVTTTRRIEGLNESIMDIHHLLRSHVYCARCELTLRSTYASLMGLAGEP